MTQYNTDNLELLTYLTCDSSIRAEFEHWLGAMTEARDGECGHDRIDEDGEIIPGILTWVREHNASFVRGGLFQTFIFWDKTKNSVVATVTIAVDDRDVKATYEIGGDGLWGGVNVRFDLRNQGIGAFACAAVDEYISNFAVILKRPLTFHLFTANPVAEKIYEGLGFSINPIGSIHTDAFGEERLWSKTYLI